MPLYRRCGYPRCPNLAPDGKNWCAEHQVKQDAKVAAHTVRRRRSEPWRFLYRLPAWTFCKKTVRARDEFRCVEIEDGERCDVVGDPRQPGLLLQVHHRAPLATLWERANGDVALFIAWATNPDYCETRCARHHKAEDERLRAEQQEFRNESKYAKPRRSHHRRKRR